MYVRAGLPLVLKTFKGSDHCDALGDARVLHRLEAIEANIPLLLRALILGSLLQSLLRVVLALTEAHSVVSLHVLHIKSTVVARNSIFCRPHSVRALGCSHLPELYGSFSKGQPLTQLSLVGCACWGSRLVLPRILHYRQLSDVIDPGLR